MLALCEDEGVIGTAFYLMTFVDGRVLWDPALPDLPREDRRPIYDSMNEGLARLHSIDVAAAGLSDYGKPGSYFGRQYQRWTDQYRASETARDRGHGAPDRLACGQGSRRTTAASRWCTATGASTT